MSNAVIDAETESKAWNLLQSVVMIRFSENKFKKRPEAREGENFIKSIDSVLRPKWHPQGFSNLKKLQIIIVALCSLWVQIKIHYNP